jgi:hypothetical protein
MKRRVFNAKRKTQNVKFENIFLFLIKTSASLRLCALISLLAFSAAAQSADDEPKDLVPPSPKLISQEEKKQLEGQSDVKKRTELSLDFMEVRLKKAETATTEEDYRAALDALAGFQALLDDSLKFLARNNNESRKVLNSFKTLEMTLRKQTPRLEVVRRGMPFKYGWYVQKLIKAVRDARSKAVEPLFGDTVVPENNS